MEDSIFLLNERGKLDKIRAKNYASEEMLQELLEAHPDLLPGVQTEDNSSQKWLLLSREGAIPSKKGGSGRFFTDFFFVGQEAVLTIIEVKRSTDTRIRRNVVGQMFDYAANAMKYVPLEKLKESFNKICKQKSKNPDKEIERFSGVKAKVFWNKLGINIQEKNLRLIFLADKIPIELQSIVEFLDEKLDNTVEVRAVEIKQYPVNLQGKRINIIVPIVIRQTAKAYQNKKIRRKLTEDVFFEDARKNLTNSQFKSLKGLYEFSKKIVGEDNISWTAASFTPIFKNLYKTQGPFSVYPDGKLMIKFWMNWQNNKQIESSHDKFSKQLSRIFGERFSFSKWRDIGEYNLPKEEWMPHVNEFTNVIKKMIIGR